MRALMMLLGLLACEPPKAGQQPEATSSAAASPTRPDACRDDVPDCAAACALRETGRRDYIDFFERRCASVILGKNPEKVPAPAAVETASAHAAPEDSAHQAHVQLTTNHAPFDPSSVTRMGGNEPAECRAARLLRAQKRDRDADMLDALCVAKGGALDGGM